MNPRELSRFAREFEEMKRRLAAVEMSAGHLRNSSIEAGSLDVRDETGALVAVIGQQLDGTYTAASLNGPKPPTPTAPTLIEGMGSVTARWDGMFVDADGNADLDARAPMDFALVEVHASIEEGFVPDTDTLRGAITSPRAGEKTMVLEPGTWYFALVTKAQSGQASGVSGYATGSPRMVDSADIFEGALSDPTRWEALDSSGPGTFDLSAETAAPIMGTDSLRVDVAATGTGSVRSLATWRTQPGAQWRTTAKIRFSAAFAGDATVHVWTAADQASLFTATATDQVSAAVTADGTVQQLDGVVTVPEGHTWMGLSVGLPDGSIAGGYSVAIDDVSHRLMIEAAQILDLTADKIRVGELGNDVTLADGMVKANSLEAVLALVTKLCSSETGRRWEADPAGIRVYDADGTILINFPTDADSFSSFYGDLVATSLTVTDQLAIRGTVNEISKAAQLVLATGTTAPSTSPTVVVDWESFTTAADATFDPYKYGAVRVGSYVYYAQDVYGGKTVIGRRNADTGATDLTWSNLTTGLRSGLGGLTAIGNVVYVLGTRVSATLVTTWWVEGWDVGTRAKVSEWQYPQGTDHRTPGIGTDGTNIVVALTNATNTVQWRVFDKASGAKIGSTVVSNYTVAKDIVGISIGAFDYGATRAVVHAKDDTNFNVFTISGTTATRQVNDEWPVATGSKTRGFYWDTARSRFVSYTPTEGRFHVYTGIKWTTESSTWWASGTWYDPSTAGTGTHETAQGPRKAFTMKRRARLRVTVPPLPVRPVPNTDDDATASRLYLGRGGSDPGRSKMERNAELSGTRSVTLTAVTLPSGTSNATNAPPSASDFPLSAPARITSADGTSYVANGDGSGRWGAFEVATDGTVTVNAAPVGAASTSKAGKRGHWGVATVTPDATGYATITHGAGFTPSVVVATPEFAYYCGVDQDTITATNFQVRMLTRDNPPVSPAAATKVSFWCGE